MSDAWWWIILILMILVCVAIDRHGEKLCRESDWDCYQQNEKYRAEAGRPPIPWRGSMRRYIRDEKEIDGYE